MTTIEFFESMAERIWSAPWFTRFGLALGLAVVAIFVRDLLTPAWGSDVKLIMFLPAVLLAAWFGGILTGLLATAVCVAGATYLWLSPIHSFRIADPEEAVALVTFVLVAALTSVIIEMLHRTRHRAELQSANIAELAAERTRLIETEREARAAAEAANRAKDDFLTVVAHELRNPLAAITAAFGVLDRARTSEERVRPRQVILLQASHLARLVEDLLDAGRVMNGKIRLHRAPIDLADTLTRSVGTLMQAGRLEQHRITIDTEPVWVDADAVRVEQIVVNLLVNSVKYTPAGGSIHVTVTKETNDAVLRIRDTGIGMPPDLVPRVFGLFVQGDRPADRDPGGLGIGLSLVRRLVELHGGKVKASSDGPGQGSTFEVRLPRVIPLATRPAVSEEATLSETRH